MVREAEKILARSAGSPATADTVLVEADRAPEFDDAASVVAPLPRAAIPTWVWLTGIVVLATVVRVWQLNAVGFNSDETVYSGQAASIAGHTGLAKFFPIYRAHPLLFQSIVSVIYRLEVSDFLARLASVAFGLGTVVMTYLLGKLLYGRRAGLIAAALLAVMPYHVVVTRQVLLDGPMVFFSTLTLYLVARYALSLQPAWLFAAAGAMGLTFLSKETGIVLAASVYVFIALAPKVRARLRELLIAVAILLVVMLPFPVAMLFSHRSDTGRQFFVWQILRRPNHGMGFYLSTVPPALGLLVLAAAVAGLWYLRRERTEKETLLFAWILVPTMFFELWPVKGFQYLLPIAPAVAVLAARALARLPVTGHVLLGGVRARARLVTDVLAIVVGLSLLVPTWQRITPSDSTAFLAGSGGVVGGREAGHWVAEHVPEGAQLLSLGPSMANVIQFYGRRKTFGLSVSSNPLHRNPVYEPVPNPDRMLRRGDLQYLVWDSYSAHRSSVFAEKLLRLAARYHGRIVHTEWVSIGGHRRSVIVVYEVRP